MSRTPPGRPYTIDQAHLRRVRNLARESGRSVLVELERLNHGSSQALVQQLAIMFGMVAIDLAGLLGMTPAFELLPLTLAQQWRCMLLRDADGILVGVLADPFDPDLQLWLNNQARGTVLMRFTSSTDLDACLTTWALHDWNGDAPASSSRGLATIPTDQGGQKRRAQPVDEAATEQMQGLARDLLHRAMRRS